MPLQLLHTTDEEITGYYLECHGIGQRAGEFVDEWVDNMLDKLGPDDCEFLIRNVQPHLKGMWMSSGTYLYVPKTSEATRYKWGEAAVKCTNNSKLEAVRIINEKEAIDSKGNTIPIEPYKPLLPVVEEEPEADGNLEGTWPSYPFCMG